MSIHFDLGFDNDYLCEKKLPRRDYPFGGVALR